MYFLIYWIARFLKWSYRFEYLGSENLERLNKNYLLAIWHQNLLPGILAQDQRPYVVIVSKSKDAAPVAYVCERLGHQAVRGSSRKKGVDKGGQAAKAEMVEVLKGGTPGAVTVDGPRGPAKKVKRGIIEMAQESGSVIIPYTVKAARYYEFKSWDRFQFPLPFSRILVHYGVPLMVSSDQDLEEVTQTLEQSMNTDNDKVEALAKAL